MKTKKATLTATDGTEITIVVPDVEPISDARADELRELFRRHSLEIDGHWKGALEAWVPTDRADDVAEAFEFMGALIDERRTTAGGRITYLFSKGYWAHGF